MAGYIGAQHLPDVYTKNEIDAGDAVLEAVKRVDGQGSGLDADKIHGKTGSDLNAELSSLNVKSGVMTKAEFEALAAQRREEFAGSGFVEWGNGDNSVPNAQGICVREHNILFPDAANYIQLGAGIGDLKTFGSSIININGYIHKLDSGAGYSTRATAPVKLPQPNLPTIESDSSNLSKDYKQGDNILLNDSDRELVSNGTFDTGIDEWGAGYGATVSYDDTNKRLKVEDLDGSDGYVETHTTVKLIKGVTYRFYAELETSTNLSIRMQISGVGSNFYNHDTGATTIDFEFKSPVSGTRTLQIMAYSSSKDEYYYIDNVSVKSLPNQKLTVTQDISSGTDIYANTSRIIGVDSFSRQDLVFLENQYEDVSEKDIVYPYGNIQYAGGDTDGLSGIADGSFTGADTYSLFGNWQEAGELVGKGYVWSSLTEEDKRKIASNPENNIYLDGENYTQVRHKIRVIKGLSNELSGMYASGSYKITAISIGGLYDIHLDVGTNSVRGIPGKLLILEPDGNMYIVNRRDYRINDYDSVVFISKSNKKPALGSTVVILSETPVRYKTNTVSIANIQRRNQGVYHPVYNQEGCAKVNDGGDAKFWYESSLINSVEDCFKPSLILGGNIASGVSGRPDGLFADEVNERDVEDLRMDAHKVTDYKGYLEQKFNDAVAGKIRGKEKRTRTVAKKFQVTSSGENWIGDNFGYGDRAHPEWSALGANNNSNWTYKGGSVFTDPKITAYIKTPEKIYMLDVKKYPDMAVSNTSNGRTEFRNITIDLTNAEWVVVVTHLEESYENNNTALVCDIIGDPRKIQDRVKYTGGTHSLVKGDYVKHGDNYYLSLANRSDVDLNNDDYGNTSNWTDLGTNGAAAGYPQEWVENGIFGTPLLVGENGESNLLSNIHESYKGGYRIKLSRKKRHDGYNVQKVLVTLNGETIELPLVVNYTHIISEGDLVGYYYNKYDNTLHFNLTGTGGYDTDIEEKAIIQVFYETTSNNTELASNQGVIALTDAWRLEGDIAKWGVSLYQNLINKVGVNSKLGSASSNLGLIKGYYNRPYSVNELGNYYTDIPQVDDSLISIKPHEGSRIKILPYLTISNNRAQMNLVFKEMKFDNATINQDGSPTDTWGDDNKFQIIDGVSTLTDDNGNTVLYGQKAIKLDRFITEG